MVLAIIKYKTMHAICRVQTASTVHSMPRVVIKTCNWSLMYRDGF